MKVISMVGIDLAKESFQIHGVDEHGKAILRKSLKRRQMLEFFATLPITTICMEACGGSNYWARKFSQMGHEVRIISAQYVKPFVKSQKNDRNDAEAIVEAASRPSMRFVSPKQVWQQDIQNLHRIRQRLQGAKTALINQTRSLLLEYGIVIKEGVTHFKKQIPLIIENPDNELTHHTRSLIKDLYDEYLALEERKSRYDAQLEELSESNEVCKRLMQVPGVGPLTSTAFVAAVGDPRNFKNGRQCAAWLGLVPRQSSTGGKTRLLGITKRGDAYLRSLLVHGARAVASSAKLRKSKSHRHDWIINLTEKKGINRVAVAIANHNVRVLWAMLKSGENYRAA